MSGQHVAPNPAGAVDAPIAFLFAIVRPWRRATDQHRWTTGASQHHNL
jgi:hypothetical protein